MTTLLIVENEPFIEAEIRSIQNRPSFDIEVYRVNGTQALEFIEKYAPEIVITDSSIPQMDDLKLMKISRERFGILPVFIIVSDHKDFHLLQEAMKYHIVDYLIKYEVNQDLLLDSMKKALQCVEEAKKCLTTFSHPSNTVMNALYDKFFIQLLLNLFENEEQIYQQAAELNLNVQASSFAVCQCGIVDFTPMGNLSDRAKFLEIYNNVFQMVRENIEKHILCYVSPLDTKHFSIIFCIDKKEEKNYKNTVKNILNSTFSMVQRYYSVSILTSVGRLCNNASAISEAYQNARQIFSAVSIDIPILFYDDVVIDNSTKNIFNISLYKEELKKAFEESDTDALSYTFGQITEIIYSHPTHFLQSVDVACNILFLSISLLPHGDVLVSDIFKDDPFGYRSIYKQTNVSQIVNWLFILRDGLCNALRDQCKIHKNPIVTNVKRYISLHIDEKLTLPAIASIYGISANYLSNLFKKYNDIGFSEYITQLKIQKAKHLMMNSNMKIYEVADKMGFESAFYFSKVFKKVEGVSPRDYLQNRMST